MFYPFEFKLPLRLATNYGEQYGVPTVQYNKASLGTPSCSEPSEPRTVWVGCATPMWMVTSGWVRAPTFTSLFFCTVQSSVLLKDSYQLLLQHTSHKSYNTCHSLDTWPVSFKFLPHTLLLASAMWPPTCSELSVFHSSTKTCALQPRVSADPPPSFGRKNAGKTTESSCAAHPRTRRF